MQVEAKVKDMGEVRYVARPFDESLQEIPKSKIITAEDLVQARINKGKRHSLSTNGSYVMGGDIMIPNEGIVL
ncbi:MAG TPA: hypothetical protein ENI76_10525, partial [Ignavibacteria bacterium]|nr:hypothetical protein [Ignavibacteria bacterium]